MQLLHLTMLGLTRIEEADTDIVARPALAKKITWRNPLLLEIQLRPDARWSNGERLTPLQVMRGLKNARTVLPSLRKISSPKDDTLQIELFRPTDRFVERLAHAATFPLYSNKSVGKDAPTLGAYRIRRQSAEEIVLVRNDLFIGTAPAINEIILHHNEEETGLFSRTVPQIPSTLALVIDPRKIPSPQMRAALFQSIDLEEPLRLLRWPHQKAHRVLPLSGESGALDTHSKSLPPLSWKAQTWTISDGQSPWQQELSENIAAQLAKNLNLAVAIAKNPAGGTLSLVEVRLDPLQPYLGMETIYSRLGMRPKGTVEEAERTLLANQLVFPMYRTVDERQSAAPMPWLALNPFGYWEVLGTKAGV